MTRRRTLAGVARIEGFGLFSDAPASITMHPASAGGLRFARGPAETTATIDHLTQRRVHPAFSTMQARCTGIELPGGSAAFTVEHLLSALAALGVTDARLELEGPEVPIVDGSAAAFVEAIDRAGLVELDAIPRPRLSRACVVGQADGPRVVIEPADALTMTFHLDYGPTAPIARQSATWDGTPGQYRSDIAPARTFCLLHEAEAMQSLGLFARLSPKDFLVFGTAGPVDNTLRFDNEPARHKLLDLIGDLALAGLPWPAMRVEAFGSGHALHHEAARTLVAALGEAGTV